MRLAARDREMKEIKLEKEDLKNLIGSLTAENVAYKRQLASKTHSEAKQSESASAAGSSYYGFGPDKDILKSEKPLPVSHVTQADRKEL